MLFNHTLYYCETSYSFALRLSALEKGLLEKQDLLSRMAKCLAWLSQAERHLTTQRPLGTDCYRVTEQYEAQKVCICVCVCACCVCVCVCACTQRIRHTKFLCYTLVMAECFLILNLVLSHHLLAGCSMVATHLMFSIDCGQLSQGFWSEALEKKPEIESVISAGKHIAMEMHWPQGMDGLRTQYISLQDRWGKVWREGEEWGKLLDAVCPEMQHFQVCTNRSYSCMYITCKLVSIVNTCTL